MKTKPNIQTHSIRAVSLVPKLAIFSALAIFVASPLADAKPKHHRDRGGNGRHFGHRQEFRQEYRHQARHHHHPQNRRVVRRDWGRPGFHGAYPPAGYVNYHYIRSLPRGYRTVYRDGYRYYYADGRYYWPAAYNNRGIFIQVSF